MLYTVELRIHKDYWNGVEIPHQTIQNIQALADMLNAAGREYEIRFTAEEATDGEAG